MSVKFLTNVDMNTNQVLNLVHQLLATDPVSPTEGQIWHNTTSHQTKYYTGSATIILYDAATTSTASKLVLRDSSGDFAAHNITANQVTGLAAPSNASDATTKSYVDTIAQGLSVKPSAIAATTTTLAANTYANGSSGVGATLTGDANGAFATIDGVAATLNAYYLVKNEASGLKNGLYKLTTLGDGSNPYVLTRAVEMDLTSEFVGGYMYVEGGTVNGATQWACTNATAPTVGTTAITFSQFAGATTLTFSTPLLQTGTTISLNLNARLVNNSGNLDLASSIVTAGTYTAVTVDTYGRTTAGADIVSGNGMVTKTTSGTFTARTITGTSAKITVTNGDGVSGNPTLTIASDYIGQSSITTLGSITTGVWTGTTIAVANGGTGSTTAAGARTALNAAGKYQATIGDNSATVFTITQATHLLATDSSMLIQVQDDSTGAIVFPDIVIAKATGTITLTFATAPTTNQYRVVVLG